MVVQDKVKMVLPFFLGFSIAKQVHLLSFKSEMKELHSFSELQHYVTYLVGFKHFLPIHNQNMTPLFIVGRPTCSSIKVSIIHETKDLLRNLCPF